MKKKSHNKKKWEAFCFPTTALAATNCKQSKIWHVGCDISAVTDVSLQCILGQPKFKCRYESWDAETMDLKNYRTSVKLKVQIAEIITNIILMISCNVLENLFYLDMVHLMTL